MKPNTRLLSTVLGTVLLGTAATQASTYVLEDDKGGNSFGNTAGIVLDVDTTFNAFWGPDLVSGQQYTLDSISFYENSNTVGARYVSVYTGTGIYDGNTSDTHLGHSTNTIDFSTVTNGSLVTFNFTGITVTAGSDGWLGEGSLFFGWDNDATRNNNSSSEDNAVFRINVDTAPSTVQGAAIYAFGGISGNRSPELQVSLTPVPEPSVALLSGLGVLGLLRRRR